MQPQPLPLDSAWLKLTRAGLHLETLKYEVLRFRQSNPYHVVKDIDPQTGEQRTYGVIDRQPDYGMALVLGDLVNALHSALDHAVFNLSVHFETAEGRTIPENQRASIKFPVAIRECQWSGGGEGGLKFLPGPYKDAIRSEQPYITGQGVARPDDPLAVLHAIWNADKHRHLVLQSAWVNLMVFEVTYDNIVVNHQWRGPIAENSSNVLYSSRPDDPEEHLDVFGNIEVTLEKGGVTGCEITPGRPIVEVASGMYEVVRAILGKLDEGALRIYPWEPGEREAPHTNKAWGRHERYIPAASAPPLITDGLAPDAPAHSAASGPKAPASLSRGPNSTLTG
jgi:hypothetical protein